MEKKKNIDELLGSHIKNLPRKKLSVDRANRINQKIIQKHRELNQSKPAPFLNFLKSLMEFFVPRAGVPAWKPAIGMAAVAVAIGVFVWNINQNPQDNSTGMATKQIETTSPDNITSERKTTSEEIAETQPIEDVAAHDEPESNLNEDKDETSIDNSQDMASVEEKSKTTAQNENNMEENEDDYSMGYAEGQGSGAEPEAIEEEKMSYEEKRMSAPAAPSRAFHARGLPTESEEEFSAQKEKLSPKESEDKIIPIMMINSLVDNYTGRELEFTKFDNKYFSEWLTINAQDADSYFMRFIIDRIGNKEKVSIETGNPPVFKNMITLTPEQLSRIKNRLGIE